MPTQPIQAPETYQHYEDRLNPGNHLFACGECGHKSGDPRTHNFLAQCPGCERLVRHYRIIQ